MLRLLYYPILESTWPLSKASTSVLSGGKPWRCNVQKKQLATVPWRSYLGVSQSGCAILHLIHDFHLAASSIVAMVANCPLLASVSLSTSKQYGSDLL